MAFIMIKSDEVVYCERCKKEMTREHHTEAALGHDWSEWTVIKEPTAEAESEEQRTCRRCGETETRSIPRPQDVHYRVTQGDGTAWTRGSSDDLIIRYSRNAQDEMTFRHFTGIKVDGRNVPASAYTAEAGSVIIKLHPQYLETLSTGQHVLSASFDDGRSDDAHFTIVEAKRDDTVPDTADHNRLPILGWMAALGMSMLVLLVTLRERLLHR